jgi:hypothetical protein
MALASALERLSAATGATRAPAAPCGPAYAGERLSFEDGLFLEEGADLFYRQVMDGSMLFQGITDQSLGHLERTRLHAGQRELFPMVQALAAFGKSRDAAKRVRSSVGFKC